jgi:D-alanyl-D-alanine dipeptidase
MKNYIWKNLLIGFLFMLQACSKNEIVSIVDSRVLSIPIQESHEPLLDLREQSTILFGPSPEIPNNFDYIKLRESVYLKLIEAQKTLPNGLQFCVYEGYRSLKLQHKLFHDRYLLLKQEHPDWDHVQLFHETTKLVSPVTNLDGFRNIPPHSTGAAIDIYLIDNNKRIVDMGIKVADWMQDIDGSISKTDSSKISNISRQNREIMSSSLTKAGFVNYPGEYWHWSYGDRYWAFHVGAKEALYGTVE